MIEVELIARIIEITMDVSDKPLVWECWKVGRAGRETLIRLEIAEMIAVDNSLVGEMLRNAVFLGYTLVKSKDAEFFPNMFIGIKRLHTQTPNYRKYLAQMYRLI